MPFMTYVQRAKTFPGYEGKTVRQLWTIYHRILLQHMGFNVCIGNSKLAALLSGAIGDNIGSKHRVDHKAAPPTIIEGSSVTLGGKTGPVALPKWKVEQVLHHIKARKAENKAAISSVTKLLHDDHESEDKLQEELAADHNAIEYMDPKAIKAMLVKNAAVRPDADAEQEYHDRGGKKYNYGKTGEVAADEEQEISKIEKKIAAAHKTVKFEQSEMDQVDDITGLRPGDVTAKDTGLIQKDYESVEMSAIKFTPGETVGRPVESVDKIPDIVKVETDRDGRRR